MDLVIEWILKQSSDFFTPTANILAAFLGASMTLLTQASTTWNQNGFSSMQPQLSPRASSGWIRTDEHTLPLLFSLDKF